VRARDLLGPQARAATGGPVTDAAEGRWAVNKLIVSVTIWLIQWVGLIAIVCFMLHVIAKIWAWTAI
jgi:hypothetical protein